ncbi:MAG: energy transducer TonB [Adhaeribacter sp.]
MPFCSPLRPYGLLLSAALSCAALSLITCAAPYQVKAGGFKNQLAATEALSAKPDRLKPPVANSKNPADRFPGGKKALQNYLGQNLRYPAPALKENRTGQVRIQVSVDARGHLKDFKILQADHELFAEEALRVLKGMPEWQPEDTSLEPVTLVFPIVFYLQDQAPMPAVKAELAPEKYHLMAPFYIGAIGNPKAAPLAAQLAASPEDRIYTVVETKPEFPGGEKKMKDFVMQNLRYPADALRTNTKGLVIVQFVVGSEGKIRDIRVVKPLGKGTDEEAMRVVGLMPDFKPAMHKGKPVAFRYTMPFRFGITNTVVEEVEFSRSRKVKSRSFE